MPAFLAAFDPFDEFEAVGIFKHQNRCFKRDAMFEPIRFGFCVVPLKPHPLTMLDNGQSVNTEESPALHPPRDHGRGTRFELPGYGQALAQDAVLLYLETQLPKRSQG